MTEGRRYPGRSGYNMEAEMPAGPPGMYEERGIPAARPRTSQEIRRSISGSNRALARQALDKVLMGLSASQIKQVKSYAESLKENGNEDA